QLLLPDPPDHGDDRGGRRGPARAGVPGGPRHHARGVPVAGRGGRMSAESPREAESSGLLLTARDIRALAEATGIRPSKQRGQNFVMDPNTVRTIVGRARLDRGQAVLEVGPGLGSLTLGLLEAGTD